MEAALLVVAKISRVTNWPVPCIDSIRFEIESMQALVTESVRHGVLGSIHPLAARIRQAETVKIVPSTPKRLFGYLFDPMARDGALHLGP